MATALPNEAAVAAAMVPGPDSLADWLVVLPLLIPLLTGAVLVMLRHRPRLHFPLAFTGISALFLSTLGLLWLVAHQEAMLPVVMLMGNWQAPFGIVFEADIFGATLAAAAAFLALCILLDTRFTVNAHESRYGFYPLFMLLMAGLSGAFLTGDLFNLYVWFEVVLISSLGLLVIGSEKAQLDAALKYGFLNLLATTFFLLATGLLYGAYGALNMADIALYVGHTAKAPESYAPAPLLTIAALFFVAFGMKAAVFPLNFWLPAAYHTPRASVSALFAALLTKLGVYALFKTLLLIMAPQGAMLASLAGVLAAATMLLGALIALAQSEIRRLLNWLVISGIGNMLLGLALTSGEARTGAIFYLIHSMLVMAALYLLAGIIEERTGTGKIHALGGLWTKEPVLSALLLLLLATAAGLPPFLGFWPKFLLVDAAFKAGAPWLAASLLIAAFLTTLALFRLFLHLCWRPPSASVTKKSSPSHEEKRALRFLPVALLMLPILVLGLYPAPLYFLSEASAVALGDLSAYAAPLWGPGR